LEHSDGLLDLRNLFARMSGFRNHACDRREVEIFQALELGRIQPLPPAQALVGVMSRAQGGVQARNYLVDAVLKRLQVLLDSL
jgi:hypothetical protein